jgi:hypothetical protein
VTKATKDDAREAIYVKEEIDIILSVFNAGLAVEKLFEDLT